MKFRRGAWLWEPGITPASIRRTIEHDIRDDALWIAAVDRSEDVGESKFEGTVLQLCVTSPLPDVIRVRIEHHRPRGTADERFELDYGLRAEGVTIDDAGDELVFTSGRLAVRFPKRRGWYTSFEADGKPLTRGAHESLAYMQVAGDQPRLMQRLSLDIGECIYGMGERFGPLVKNGQSVSIWNEDGGTNSDWAYKNIPFYLSTAGYGLLVNSPGKVEFEVGTERVSAMQFSVPGEVLDYYVFYGPDPKSIFDKYTRLAGRPATPPAWSAGLWLSTSFTTKYDEATVNEFVDGMASRDIPLSVFHFDCFWMKQRHWCDFEWDEDAFPDPSGMLKRLKDKGLHVCVWINPYISQLSKIFDEGVEGGFFLKRADGSVYQRDQWQPGMALVDFTNPVAVKWYQSKLRTLLKMGVDCFKTDFAERIPTDAVYHDGSDPRLMHNLYAYLYNKAVFEVTEEQMGVGNAMVFARSASGGSQKFPVHWGGDCDATFEAMAEDLRGGLSFCLSGPAFWSHDIGGFNGTANRANYKRWVQFGLLSTHSRLHGSGSYRVPWLFDDNLDEGEASAVEVMRTFSKLKNRLFPYLYNTFHEASEHGWPAMRAMVVEFPDDPTCHHLDRQYMLGSSLLVAPIFSNDGSVQYYVPAGRWTNLLTGAVIDGPTWRRETFDFLSMPLLVRQDTLLPMSDNEDAPQWTLNDPLTLHLSQVTDGATLSATAIASDGKRVTFTGRCEGKSITIEQSGGAKRVAVQLPGGSRRAWADIRKPLIVRLGE